MPQKYLKNNVVFPPKIPAGKTFESTLVSVHSVGTFSLYNVCTYEQYSIELLH